MSTATQWVLRSIGDRLGFVVVIAVAGVGASFVAGDSLIAAIFAVGAVVILGAVVFGRRDEPASDKSHPQRMPGSPYSALHAWTVSSRPDLADISQSLVRGGLTLRVESSAPGKVVLRGGSQIRTRLLGGYFVDPKRLPIRVELGINEASNGRWSVDLAVRDTFGIAIRDRALEDRFKRAAARIQNAVEERLSSNDVL